MHLRPRRRLHAQLGSYLDAMIDRARTRGDAVVCDEVTALVRDGVEPRASVIVDVGEGFSVGSEAEAFASWIALNRPRPPAAEMS